MACIRAVIRLVCGSGASQVEGKAGADVADLKRSSFYYEALWNLVGFGLLWLGGRRFTHWLRDGDIFFLYLVWYAAGRFWVEMFRPDAWRMGTLATAQWFALAGIALGVTGLLFNHLRSRAGTTDESPAGLVGRDGEDPAA